MHAQVARQLRAERERLTSQLEALRGEHAENEQDILALRERNAELTEAIEHTRARVRDIDRQFPAPRPSESDLLRLGMDLAAEYRAFTLPEFTAVAGLPPGTAKRVMALLSDRGIVRREGAGRGTMYLYVAPSSNGTPATRPRGTPVEKLPPSYGEAPPRGLPVRLRKVTRREASTPGQRHKAKMRDLAYQREQAAKEARAEQQRSKAQKAPKWKRNK